MKYHQINLLEIYGVLHGCSELPPPALLIGKNRGYQAQSFTYWLEIQQSMTLIAVY